jgi:transposase-like protein
MMACIDGLNGFPEATNGIYPRTEVRLCVFQKIRNLVKWLTSKPRRVCVADSKPVYRAVLKGRQKWHWMS